MIIITGAGVAPVKATVAQNVGKKPGKSITGWSVQWLNYGRRY